MRTPDLIVSHSNTDFDAFAGMVAVHKLYPGAHLCLGGAVNRNVREFQALYADLVPVVDATAVERDSVRRLILVDTVHANRLGELAELCRQPGVEVLAFDHHARGDDLPPYLSPERLVTADVGSLVTLLVRILAERDLAVDPFEASLFAIGIHEDTGSLTFATTTPDDVEALAFCLRHGADMRLVERWLTNPLTPAQRLTLARALAEGRERSVAGASVFVAALREREYVESVSLVAHRVMDLTGCDALLLLVEMEGRVFVTARSRGGRVDVAAVMSAVGGGGHPAAASAVVKDATLDEVRERLEAALGAAVRPVATVAEVLDEGPPAVTSTTTVDDALLACRRAGLDALAVREGGALVGTVTVADLERADAHGLGHAPVRAVASGRVPVVGVETPLGRAGVAFADAGIGWLAAVAGSGSGARSRLPLADVRGMVTRRRLAMGETATQPPEPGVPVVANLAGALAHLGLDDLLRAVQTLAASVRGVYLVGGAVRDLLLGEANIDVDIAVEGDGVAFADRLAARLGGRVRAHEKFGTAVVLVGEGEAPLRVDVASTRRESYAYPGALPKVQHAGIRSDLARRDFTINAMAVALAPERFGDLIDFFGGVSDLEARRLVVLHNLSFIDDPTRILRAARYEARYGLRMDAHTESLARACCAMDLVGDLSSARLRDELVALLEEERVGPAVARLEDLGLWPSVHPRLRGDATTRALLAADRLRESHGLAAEVPRWRLRLACLLRDLEPEEVLAWGEGLRLRRRDCDVLARTMVTARRLLERVARGPTEAELFELLCGQPLEAVVVAMALDDGGTVRDRLAHYLAVSRHVRLEIDGHDLLAHGMAQSPELGEILRSVLHLKLNGVVAGRAAELAAALRLAPSPSAGRRR